MSPRTRFIIATLFVALLSLPLGYVMLTWSPANPLRFRLVGSTRAPAPPVDGGVLYEVEVRNTSYADILLFDTRLFSREPTGKPLRTIGGFRARTSSSLFRYGYSVVPAHGTIRFGVEVTPQDARYVSAGDTGIEYRWISQTRRQWMHVQRWNAKHLLKRPPAPGTATATAPSLEELNGESDLAELSLPATVPPP